MRFYLDGTEVTDARRTIYGYLTSMTESFEYTINCNASSVNTAHGDITSWSGAKVMKLQGRENIIVVINVCYTKPVYGMVVEQLNLFLPTIEIISFKDS